MNELEISILWAVSGGRGSSSEAQIILSPAVGEKIRYVVKVIFWQEKMFCIALERGIFVFLEILYISH